MPTENTQNQDREGLIYMEAEFDSDINTVCLGSEVSDHGGLLQTWIYGQSSGFYMWVIRSKV